MEIDQQHNGHHSTTQLFRVSAGDNMAESYPHNAAGKYLCVELPPLTSKEIKLTRQITNFHIIIYLTRPPPIHPYNY